MVLEKVRSLHSEIPPASHDTYPAVSIKAEVFSDAEEEECPVPLTFVGIKAEPEVSYVSVSTVCGVSQTGISSFVILCYSEQLIFVKAEKYTTWGKWGDLDITTCLNLPLSWSVQLPSSVHTESAMLLTFIFYP
jgi:hypothetical protein